MIQVMRRLKYSCSDIDSHGMQIRILYLHDTSSSSNLKYPCIRASTQVKKKCAQRKAIQ